MLSIGPATAVADRFAGPSILPLKAKYGWNAHRHYRWTYKKSEIMA
jgi:hypothetical protein